MKKHKWEHAWEDKKFEMETLTPSILVSKYSEKLKSGDPVLDIGCGNGRNSIFFARCGCKVDSFDVMDLRWREKLSPDLQDKIYFKKSSILDYSYNTSYYQAIIATRVIQYLCVEELTFLIEKIKKSLKSNGFLLLSYNTRGGIFNRKEIDVHTSSHTIEKIEKLLKEIFKVVIVTEGSKVSKHVNYTDEIRTFDIYASDLYVTPQISE